MFQADCSGQFQDLPPTRGEIPVRRAVGIAAATAEQTPVSLFAGLHRTAPITVLPFVSGFAEEERAYRLFCIFQVTHFVDIGLIPVPGLVEAAEVSVDHRHVEPWLVSG